MLIKLYIAPISITALTIIPPKNISRKHCRINLGEKWWCTKKGTSSMNKNKEHRFMGFRNSTKQFVSSIDKM